MRETDAERLEAAFEMWDDGVRLYRERLRRERPHATEAELDDAVGDWLGERPGAAHGDAVGTVGSWPRPPRK